MIYLLAFFFLLEAHYPLFVKLPTGKRISLEFKSSDTIDMVKFKIQVTERIAADGQILKLDGQELEDNRRLSYYDIQAKSTVELIERAMEIFVVTAIHGKVRTLSLNVYPSDTLKSVKLKIQGKIGILPDKQILITDFHLDLKDDLSLTHYHIWRGSRLYLFPSY